MRKLFSCLLVFALCFQIAPQALAASDYALARKTAILEGTKLNDTVQGKKYKSVIDQFVATAPKEKLETVKERSAYVLSTGNYSGETLSLLSYLHAQTVLKTETMQTETPTQVVDLEAASETEEQAATKSILQLQNHIYNDIESLLKSLETSYETSTNYSESGAFLVDVEADMDLYGSFKYFIEGNDYEMHQNGLDSETKFGDTRVLFEMSQPDLDESMKLELQTDADVIQKNGNLYLLLKKFNIIEQEGLEDIAPMFTKLKELTEKNSYLAFEDEAQDQVFNWIKNYNRASVMQHFTALKTEAMFDVVGKKDGKLVLQVNANICELLTKLPDGPSEQQCREEIASIQNDVATIGYITLEITKNADTLRFAGTEDGTTVDMHALYNPNSIVSLGASVDGEEKEKLAIKYIKNQKISYDFHDGYETQSNIMIALGANNAFTSLDFAYSDPESEMKAQFANDALTLNMDMNNYYSSFTLDADLGFDGYVPVNGSVIASSKYKDYETEAMSEGFSSSLFFKNGNLTGTTIIPDFTTIEHSGELKNGYMNIKNTMSEIVSYDDTMGKLSAYVNMIIDTRDNNANFTLTGAMSEDNDEFASMEIKSLSKREYDTSVEIKKPERVIDMEEFIEDFYNF